MSIHPEPTRWFEVLVLKRDLDAALDCLAQTGAVQLEQRTDDLEQTVNLADLISQYDAMAARYGAWWPEPAVRPAGEATIPGEVMAQAMTFLRSWAAEADETIERLQGNLRKRDDLEILRILYLRAQADTPNLSEFLKAGPRFRSLVFRLPPEISLPDMSDELVSMRLQDEGGDFLLAMGVPKAMWDLESQLVSQKCRVVRMPEWLPDDPAACRQEIDRQLVELRDSCHRDEQFLDRLGHKHGLAEVLGDIARSKWLGGLMPEVGQTRRMAWITGWTTDMEGSEIEKAMTTCGIHHFVAFPAAPPGRSPPVTLHNPVWSRPFEALTRLLGLPAAKEADPSTLVSIIAPLLFGFMFGDVGQGFVLLVAGIVLRRRNPIFSVLISGGAVAMVFGVLFGSVFSLEDVVPALWLRPLEEPVTLLVVSVAVGGAILLLGLILDMLQLHWQGRAAQWWRTGAGLLLSYCGVLTTAFHAWAGLAMIVAGVIWWMVGEGLNGGGAASLRGLGKAVEALVQIAVNTISFARTGAFALAHAGLAVAVVELARATGPIGFWPALAIGNAFIIALEGLVVSIQTTRLILFEFFLRFLHAGGREFRPLKPPHDVNSKMTREAQ